MNTAKFMVRRVTCQEIVKRITDDFDLSGFRDADILTEGINRAAESIKAKWIGVDYLR